MFLQPVLTDCSIILGKIIKPLSNSTEYTHQERKGQKSKSETSDIVELLNMKPAARYKLVRN